MALQKIMRIAAVVETTGIPKSSIWDKISRNEFPAPIPLGKKAVGWLESDLIEWQAARIAERDQRQGAF